MFSICERAQPANVEGRSVDQHERLQLSPEKRRINLMVVKTRALLLPNKTDEERYRYCRTHIDQTNRGYREQLKIRKKRIFDLEKAKARNNEVDQVHATSNGPNSEGESGSPNI